MGTQESIAASAGDDRDDLAKIAGIGTYWANALHKVGIDYFKDLARFSPSDLSQVLAKAGFSASPEKTVKWIEEAKERSWETHAEFSIFFEYQVDEDGGREWQTRVYGEKKAGIQAPFQGVEPGPWTEWILEQAKLPPSVRPLSAPTKAAPLPSPMELDDAQIEILSLQVSEIEPSPGAPNPRLAAEICFQVSGPQAAKLMQDRIPFQTEIYVVDPESGAFDLVTSKGGELAPEILKYTIRQAFQVPALGCYEVYAIVHLLPPGKRMTYRRGPRLTVVP